MITEDAQNMLKRKCLIVNACILFLLLVIVAMFIINAPCFGNQREIFICIQVFEEYFGKWSSIPYYFYFFGYPFLYYNFFKGWMAFVYAILETQLQFLMLEAYLCEIYHTDNVKNWKYLHDTHYQEEIGKSLRLCIAHHNVLKKMFKMVVNITDTAMPFFLLLGSLILISAFAFIINFVDTMTTILKIRIFISAIVMVSITMLLSWIGQQLINVTSDIFFTLGGAPWYYWNLKNVKILLIFLTNCTKNESIILAGICLDYQMCISVRTF
nr:PREDICTED: uncharacterized protein LOC107397677 [Tribolium castaneum]|eukprot:XP_015834088.1 PREDICTED: uncharacterized protein LOC107397677 [Tribolium castaneum]